MTHRERRRGRGQRRSGDDRSRGCPGALTVRVEGAHAHLVGERVGRRDRAGRGQVRVRVRGPGCAGVGGVFDRVAGQHRSVVGGRGPTDGQRGVARDQAQLTGRGGRAGLDRSGGTRPGAVAASVGGADLHDVGRAVGQAGDRGADARLRAVLVERPGAAAVRRIAQVVVGDRRSIIGRGGPADTELIVAGRDGHAGRRVGAAGLLGGERRPGALGAGVGGAHLDLVGGAVGQTADRARGGGRGDLHLDARGRALRLRDGAGGDPEVRARGEIGRPAVGRERHFEIQRVVKVFDPDRLALRVQVCRCGLGRVIAGVGDDVAGRVDERRGQVEAQARDRAFELVDAVHVAQRLARHGHAQTGDQIEIESLPVVAVDRPDRGDDRRFPTIQTVAAVRGPGGRAVGPVAHVVVVDRGAAVGRRGPGDCQGAVTGRGEAGRRGRGRRTDRLAGRGRPGAVAATVGRSHLDQIGRPVGQTEQRHAGRRAGVAWAGLGPGRAAVRRVAVVVIGDRRAVGRRGRGPAENQRLAGRDRDQTGRRERRADIGRGRGRPDAGAVGVGRAQLDLVAFAVVERGDRGRGARAGEAVRYPGRRAADAVLHVVVGDARAAVRAGRPTEAERGRGGRQADRRRIRRADLERGRGRPVAVALAAARADLDRVGRAVGQTGQRRAGAGRGAVLDRRPGRGVLAAVGRAVAQVVIVDRRAVGRGRVPGDVERSRAGFQRRRVRGVGGLRGGRARRRRRGRALAVRVGRRDPHLIGRVVSQTAQRARSRGRGLDQLKRVADAGQTARLGRRDPDVAVRGQILDGAVAQHRPDVRLRVFRRRGAPDLRAVRAERRRRGLGLRPAGADHVRGVAAVDVRLDLQPQRAERRADLVDARLGPDRLARERHAAERSDRAQVQRRAARPVDRLRTRRSGRRVLPGQLPVGLARLLVLDAVVGDRRTRIGRGRPAHVQTLVLHGQGRRGDLIRLGVDDQGAAGRPGAVAVLVVGQDAVLHLGRVGVVLADVACAQGVRAEVRPSTPGRRADRATANFDQPAGGARDLIPVQRDVPAVVVVQLAAHPGGVVRRRDRGRLADELGHRRPVAVAVGVGRADAHLIGAVVGQRADRGRGARPAVRVRGPA